MDSGYESHLCPKNLRLKMCCLNRVPIIILQRFYALEFTRLAAADPPQRSLKTIRKIVILLHMIL